MSPKGRLMFQLIAALCGAGCALIAARAEDVSALQPYADVLNLHGAPASAHDRTINAFFDRGAWHGYSLQARPERRLGFVGPLLLARESGSWMAEGFADIEVVDRASGQKLALSDASIHSHSLPGRLIQSASLSTLTIRQTLIFSSSRTALVRVEIHSTTPQRLGLAVLGGAPLDEVRYSVSAARVVASSPASSILVHTLLPGMQSTAHIDLDGRGYRLDLSEDALLGAGETFTFFVLQSCLLDASEALHVPREPAAEFSANAARWSGYLARVFASDAPLLREPRYRRVAVKAIETMLSNWRSPSAGLRHDGLFPSYSNKEFNGFWAWDSWKHAAALAHFAPDLARSQIRAMFDYQNEAGMIADVVYRDSEENNWRNTKPPLAAWAVWEVYAASADRDFIVEMLPKLLRYHRWWYEQRDHDGDGLAEYGSTDGTRIAAAWESGMDNAVRFDAAQMLENGPHAWSLNQESVDLNSYLYLEKRRLADMADVVGDAAVAATLRRDARALQKQVRMRMFDQDTGFFYDIGIRDNAHVRVMGSEGFIPLWTHLATDRQARAVAHHLLDPQKFATQMPFPTLAADHPQFSPIKGYWRGPVWIDQAYFAVAALSNYGMNRDADRMRRRLLDNAAGLTDDAPIFENYDPLTGAGVQSPNFSWSAAHYLLLLIR